MNPFSGNSAPNPYSSSSAIRREVDLRKELHDILHADQKGTWMLYRRVRLDSAGRPVKHPDAQSNRSGEVPRDVLPINSTNSGFLYDDRIVLGYMNHSQAYSITNRFNKPGESSTDYKTLYLEWDFLKNMTGDEKSIPNSFDRIIRLEQGLDGNLISPSKVRERFDTLSVDPYRLDSQGRIEYYRFRVISVIDESFLV